MQPSCHAVMQSCRICFYPCDPAISSNVCPPSSLPNVQLQLKISTSPRLDNKGNRKRVYLSSASGRGAFSDLFERLRLGAGSSIVVQRLLGSGRGGGGGAAASGSSGGAAEGAACEGLTDGFELLGPGELIRESVPDNTSDARTGSEEDEVGGKVGNQCTGPTVWWEARPMVLELTPLEGAQQGGPAALRVGSEAAARGVGTALAPSMRTPGGGGTRSMMGHSRGGEAGVGVGGGRPANDQRQGQAGAEAAAQKRPRLAVGTTGRGSGGGAATEEDGGQSPRHEPGGGGAQQDGQGSASMEQRRVGLPALKVRLKMPLGCCAPSGSGPAAAGGGTGQAATGTGERSEAG